MGIVNNQGVFIAPPLGEGEETTLTSFREDDDFSTDIFEESVVLPDFPNNIGVAFVRSSDSPADYLTISLKGNNTSTVYVNNTANNANLSVSGDVFIGYENITNLGDVRLSYFGYSSSSFTSDLFVNGRIFAREWNFYNARMRGRTRFGLNTIIIDDDDDSIRGINIINSNVGIITNLSGNDLNYNVGTITTITGNDLNYNVGTITTITGNDLNYNVGTITTITGNNLYYQGISTFRDGPLLIGTGTSTGTEFQPLQISGGVYISDSVGIGTTDPLRKLEVRGDSLFTGESYFTDRVGIGTANTTRKLEVNGDCRISGETYIIDRVGIGVLNTTRKLEVNGNCLISGTLTATNLSVSGTKSFDIEHPTKEGYRLRYVCLEGPTADVYVRGKLKDHNVIEVPDYWSGLVDLETLNVTLTPIGIYQELYVEKIECDKKITVKNNLGGPINCNYVIYAERKDVDKNMPEYQSLDTST